MKDCKEYLVWLTVFYILMLAPTLLAQQGEIAWQPKAVGCHLVGYTRKVMIPDCIEFPVTTNACRGFCESFAVSSNFALGHHRPDQPITSVGQCCNIMESEDINVKVRCLEGVRDVTFKSATKCSCFHCKKN